MITILISATATAAMVIGQADDASADLGAEVSVSSSLRTRHTTAAKHETAVMTAETVLIDRPPREHPATGTRSGPRR